MFNDLYTHLNIISILLYRISTFTGFITTIKFKKSLISTYSVLQIKNYLKQVFKILDFECDVF